MSIALDMKGIDKLVSNLDKPMISCACGDYTEDTGKTLIKCSCGEVLIYRERMERKCTTCRSNLCDCKQVSASEFHSEAVND